ncbi:shikimate dehydrogenase [Aliikangiella sp. IMCC44653]
MQPYAQYGVIGDPIAHSLSPKIHQQFAAQFAQTIDYQKFRVKPSQLASFITQFFANGGAGLNVTLPHKQAIIPLLDQLTDRAQQCHSVNTIIQRPDGSLIGDTTDGAGLLLDLARLNFGVKKQNILVVGAGGASVSVIYALLEAGARVTVINRTLKKVEALKHQFRLMGNISSLDLLNHSQKVADEIPQFDGVISCVSEFNLELVQPIMPLLKSGAFAYDLNYAKRAQSFLLFCKQHAITRSADGWGMLLGQAALAYQHWFKCLPNINNIN